MFQRLIVLSAAIVLTASAGLAEISDSCLVGTWVPAPGAFAEQYTANAGMGNVEISGDVQMVLSATGGQYVLDGMVVRVQQPGMPPMAVAMNGTGVFSGEALSGVFNFTMGAFSYAATATVDMGGSPMVMDIPFTEEMAPMGGGAIGTYTCTDSTLNFEVVGGDGTMVKSWLRR